MVFFSVSLHSCLFLYCFYVFPFLFCHLLYLFCNQFYFLCSCFLLPHLLIFLSSLFHSLFHCFFFNFLQSPSFSLSLLFIHNTFFNPSFLVVQAIGKTNHHQPLVSKHQLLPVTLQMMLLCYVALFDLWPHPSSLPKLTTWQSSVSPVEQQVTHTHTQT